MSRATCLLLVLATALRGQIHWSESERQTLISGLNRTEQLVLDEVARLNSQQWMFRENPGRWSIAEIVGLLEKNESKAN